MKCWEGYDIRGHEMKHGKMTNICVKHTEPKKTRARPPHKAAAPQRKRAP